MKSAKLVWVFALVALLSLSYAIYAQVDTRGSASGDEIESLKAEIVKLRNQVDELMSVPAIRQVIAQHRQQKAQQAEDEKPLDITLDLANRPSKGDDDAKLTIIEFSDYQCPACRTYAQGTLPVLKREFLDTGKARLVFADFPIPRHTQAFKAAEAAHCAGEQGKYWEMHDRLFANQDKLEASLLPGHASAIGLNAGDFETCLASEKYAEGIRASMDMAQQVRLRGTPHFAVGYTKPDGQVQVVRAFSGKGYNEVKVLLEELAAAAE